MKKVHMSHSKWEHLFAVKFAAGILPTKANMVMQKHDDDLKCPCCEQEETTEHLLQCRATSQEEIFD